MFKATVDKVFLDEAPAESVVLNTFGSTQVAEGCEDLVFDYENGEYLAKIEVTFDAYTVRTIYLESSNGDSITKGAFIEESTTSTLTFAEEE